MATLESIEIQINNLNEIVNMIVDELKIMEPLNVANYTESMARIKYIYDWIGTGSVNGTGMWLRTTLNSVNIKVDKSYNWLGATTPVTENLNTTIAKINTINSNVSNILSYSSSTNDNVNILLNNSIPTVNNSLLNIQADVNVNNSLIDELKFNRCLYEP